MERNQVDPAWPNALRCFFTQYLISLTSWHFITEASELEFASRVFTREDVTGGGVFTFARRQDRNDFTGLLVVDGHISNTVVCFK